MAVSGEGSITSCAYSSLLEKDKLKIHSWNQMGFDFKLHNVYSLDGRRGMFNQQIYDIILAIGQHQTSLDQ
jgi:hypothetical protein